ncbi:MAG: hypothetical protein MZV65_00320 [Chromatiales bacterium]|nr:hypothetical protein [Chromatiales bacterium]
MLCYRKTSVQVSLFVDRKASDRACPRQPSAKLSPLKSPVISCVKVPGTFLSASAPAESAGIQTLPIALRPASGSPRVGGAEVSARHRALSVPRHIRPRRHREGRRVPDLAGGTETRDVEAEVAVQIGACDL